MGGLNALRYLALAVVASCAAVSCGLWIVVRRKSRTERTGAEALIALGIGLLAVQMTPLSPETLDYVSPRLADAFPLWMRPADAVDLHLGTWKTLSLNPTATFRGLTSFVACAVLFQVASLRIMRLDDAERLLKLVALSAITMASFGLLQYFTSNGRFFWVYEHPQSTTSTYVKGAFSNRNHFANFLAMGLGPILWWTLASSRGSDDSKRTRFRSTAQDGSSGLSSLLWTGAGLVVVAALLSLSRGGFLALCAATIVCGFIHWRAGLIPARVATCLVGGALAFGVFLAVFGLGKVEERLGTITAGSVDQLDRHDARRTIWAANWKATADFPVAGVGAGTHRETHKAFLKTWFPREFAYGESTFFQLGLETGCVGLGLAVLGVLTVLYRSLRCLFRTTSRQVKAAQAAALAGLSAAVLHGVVDFVWYMPGCAVIVATLAACTLRIERLDRHATHRFPERPPAPIPFRLALLAGSLVLSVWMVQSKIPAFLAEPHANRHFVLTRTAATSGDMSMELSRQRLECLVAAVKADPSDARLHLRLATECLLHFNDLQSKADNPMFVSQIRETAIDSGFASQDEAKEWIARVAGENLRYLEGALKHARHALQLCPAQARGYLLLSELSFLEAVDELSERGDRCLAQARLCDPTDGLVLISQAEHDWKLGRHEDAIATWRIAFHQDPFGRQKLLENLSVTVDADFFFEHLKPTWEHLLLIRDRYRKLERLDQVAVLEERIAELAVERAASQSGREAAESLRVAGDAFLKIERPDRARECFVRAVEVDGNAFEARLFLGKFLLEQKDYVAAAEHLQWCARRKPRDSRVKRLAEEATKSSLRDPTLAKTSSLYEWRRQVAETGAPPDDEADPLSLPVGTAAASFDDEDPSVEMAAEDAAEEDSADEAMTTEPAVDSSSTVQANFDDPAPPAAPSKPRPSLKPMPNRHPSPKAELTRPIDSEDGPVLTPPAEEPRGKP